MTNIKDSWITYSGGSTAPEGQKKLIFLVADFMNVLSTLFSPPPFSLPLLAYRLERIYLESVQIFLEMATFSCILSRLKTLPG